MKLVWLIVLFWAGIACATTNRGPLTAVERMLLPVLALYRQQCANRFPYKKVVEKRYRRAWNLFRKRAKSDRSLTHKEWVEVLNDFQNEPCANEEMQDWAKDKAHYVESRSKKLPFWRKVLTRPKVNKEVSKPSEVPSELLAAYNFTLPNLPQTNREHSSSSSWKWFWRRSPTKHGKAPRKKQLELNAQRPNRTAYNEMSTQQTHRPCTVSELVDAVLRARTYLARLGDGPETRLLADYLYHLYAEHACVTDWAKIYSLASSPDELNARVALTFLKPARQGLEDVPQLTEAEKDLADQIRQWWEAFQTPPEGALGPELESQIAQWRDEYKVPAAHEVARPNRETNEPVEARESTEPIYAKPIPKQDRWKNMKTFVATTPRYKRKMQLQAALDASSNGLADKPIPAVRHHLHPPVNHTPGIRSALDLPMEAAHSDPHPIPDVQDYDLEHPPSSRGSSTDVRDSLSNLDQLDSPPELPKSPPPDKSDRPDYYEFLVTATGRQGAVEPKRSPTKPPVPPRPAWLQPHIQASRPWPPKPYNHR